MGTFSWSEWIVCFVLIAVIILVAFPVFCREEAVGIIWMLGRKILKILPFRKKIV